MKAIQIEFTDKEITPWEGMSLLKQILFKSDYFIYQPNANDGFGLNGGVCPATVLSALLSEEV